MTGDFHTIPRSDMDRVLREAGIRKHRAKAPRKAARKPTWIETWAWSPVIVIRISLFASHFLTIALAIFALRAGIPIFRVTDVAWWTPYWAVLLIITAFIAAIGSFDDKLKTIERWASLVVFSLQLGYVVPIYLVGFFGPDYDLNRQAVAIGVTYMLIIPLSRFLYLVSKAGRHTAQKNTGESGAE